MKKAIGWTRIRNISIAKKLYFIVGAMAVLIAIELFTLWFSIHTLSSVRAFIGAEGLWSKAQKDALYHLGRYNRTHDESDLQAFEKFMQVPDGDHKARMELLKKDPDLDIVRQGFLEGRVHPDDIDGMIKVVRRFHKTYYIGKAMGYWSQGDSVISFLLPIAADIQKQIREGSLTVESSNEITKKIAAINNQLTILEDNFSFTLEEGSRWLENLVLKILFTVALTVEITGLIFTVLVTRNITKGLNEINRAADKITKGHLTERATVFSKDEIGRVATSVNRMTEQLVISNQELQNFAYIASHDLKEPLRKISIYGDLLKEETGEAMNEKSSQYLGKITDAVSRMQRLIEDVLQFASISSKIEFVKTDLNKLISRLLADMEIIITKKNADVIVDTIPEIEVNTTQMEQLFQNLISNALKFSTGSPLIHISAELIGKEKLPANYLIADTNEFSFPEKKGGMPEKFCRIYIKDNGIGFDEIYHDKIFLAFQRLHGRQLYEGTGIGLAICKKIVDNHHGIISAESKPGQGATFIITLPVAQIGFEKL